MKVNYVISSLGGMSSFGCVGKMYNYFYSTYGNGRFNLKVSKNFSKTDFNIIF